MENLIGEIDKAIDARMALVREAPPTFEDFVESLDGRDDEDPYLMEVSFEAIASIVVGDVFLLHEVRTALRDLGDRVRRLEESAVED